MMAGAEGDPAWNIPTIGTPKHKEMQRSNTPYWENGDALAPASETKKASPSEHWSMEPSARFVMRGNWVLVCVGPIGMPSRAPGFS